MGANLIKGEGRRRRNWKQDHLVARAKGSFPSSDLPIRIVPERKKKFSGRCASSALFQAPGVFLT